MVRTMMSRLESRPSMSSLLINGMSNLSWIPVVGGYPRSWMGSGRLEHPPSFSLAKLQPQQHVL